MGFIRENYSSGARFGLLLGIFGVKAPLFGPEVHPEHELEGPNSFHFFLVVRFFDVVPSFGPMGRSRVFHI